MGSPRNANPPVKVLFENLEAGLSLEEIMEQFPVTREQLEAVIAFVTLSLDQAPVFA